MAVAPVDLLLAVAELHASLVLLGARREGEEVVMGTEHAQLADWGLTYAYKDLRRYSEILCFLTCLSDATSKKIYKKINQCSWSKSDCISGTNRLRHLIPETTFSSPDMF